MGFLSIHKIVGHNNPLVVCGLDEAGRGPWAGPLVTCALILKGKYHLPGLKDSKQLTHEKREQLYEKLQRAAYIGVGIAEFSEIDEHGLTKAQNLAYQRAVKELTAKFTAKIDLVLVDGRSKMDISIPQKTIIKGDSKVRIIACASVIAKVERDRIMLKMAEKYPKYGFGRHKGYGTKRHQKALLKHGPSPIHRKSFAPIAELAKATPKDLH